MNLYATLDDIKSRLGIAAAVTDDDALLKAYLEAASREIDNLTERHFYAETATRYFNTGSESTELIIDDLLSSTTFTTDSETDGTYDGETWTEGATNDFLLWPWNSWPKMQVHVAVDGTYTFPEKARRYVKIIGLWGYGDGKSATPYEAAGIDVTADDASETELDVSAEDVIQAGHTILVELEQIYVSAATTDATKKITVERGVNGTTGAAHLGGKAASIYRYPKLIGQACEIATADIYSTMGSEGLVSEKIGDYSYQRLTNRGDTLLTEVLKRFLGPYMRPGVG